MLNILKNTINRVFASGVDSDASAFITATGLSGTTQKSAITTLVKDLKSSGLWSKMKAVYPMVTDNRNLLSYTEDFSNAAWTKTSVTVTANTTTAPNGTLTADTFNDGVANSLHQVYAQINSLPIGTYIFSFYYKSNTSTKNIAIYPFATSTTGGTGTGGVILTQNGTFVANVGSGVVSYGSQDVGNGWRRFYVVGTSTAISNAYPVIAFADGSNITYTGSNTDAYIWGAQLELGNTATTYQPIATTPSAFMASQMKYNLKDARDLDAAFRLTWSGGWTYSATGATPNGTNAYADTKFSPSANLNINSSHLSIYSRTAIGNLPQSDIGSYSTSVTDALTIAIAYNNVCYMGSYAFNAATNYIDFANTDSRGLYINTRTSSTSLKGFKNNTIGDSSTTSVNGILPSVNTIIGAESFNGTPTSYSTKQYAFASIGNGLSDQEALLLNQIVEKYQVALSRGVQAAQSFYYNSAYSNEANTYLYSTQITGTTQVSAINTLINGLKANNLWSKMKAVYPFVTDKTLQADMAAQMKFNLVNPQDSDAAFRLAFSGGWTYSTNGAQPNGTNGYADTKLNDSILTPNSSHLSIYSRTNSSASSYDMGIFNGANGIWMMLRNAVDQYRAGVFQTGASGELSAANTNSQGYYFIGKNGSTLASIYKNGTLSISGTKLDTSATNTTVFLSTLNQNGSPAYGFSARQISFATIGNGFSDAEAALLYQLIQQYQTDLSRQV